MRRLFCYYKAAPSSHAAVAPSPKAASASAIPIRVALPDGRRHSLDIEPWDDPKSIILDIVIKLRIDFILDVPSDLFLPDGRIWFPTREASQVDIRAGDVLQLKWRRR